ncbi:MAG: helix-turn-helix domain-containing protein [Prevotella stercorea]|uniref:helix-turn-helix domain-containing protein n=1 Tax=Leyella stercorea TaxID=363265 RepID=UPI00280270D8|nr:helix-turn-helix domain-containing protein [Leyella stercorea]MDY5552464.1 helix-turn-helix domain-containing protein [Prevotella sp.]
MLYLLQFACLIFMFISAFFIAVTRLHVRWINRRYEWSRWMIFAALLFMAVHFFLQMYFGFRATDEDVGAVINVLVYLPCFTLFSMAIYNIEATHTKRRKMNLICAAVYAAMLAAFAVGYSFSGSLNIGAWLYVMLALFFGNIVYCIYMIIIEMNKRKKLLETMTATDMQPFIRYARASIAMLSLIAISMPFAILSTKSLYIIGPVGLLVLLFFIVNFVAFGNCYVPTEELLDRERGNGETDDDDEPTTAENCASQSAADCEQSAQRLSAERSAFIQAALDKWCADMGYKDSSVNMLTLSHSLDINKNELSQFFSQCQNTTFRIWLSEIRFNAAKKMMKEFPDYNNDIISAECGFSSRSYLYRIFKEKEGCTPVEWRAKNS